MNILDATTKAFFLLFSGDEALWKIISVSLSVSFSALLLTSPVAILSAYLLSVRRFPGRQLLVVLLHGLLSFPTVVVGLILYILLSRQGVFGAYGLLFTPRAMLIGQMIIAYPVLTSFALSALQKNDVVVRETAYTLGAGRFAIMMTELYEARFGLVTSLLAGFGRIISEIGSALIVGGNIANHTRTITTAIALETGKGAFASGIALGIVLIFLALLNSAAMVLLQGSGNDR